MSWFYYVSRVLVRILLFLLTRWQVQGRENVPRQGPLLVVANHINLADPPIIALSLGRKAIFMAKKELFHSRFIGYFIGSFGAFPVHRGQVDRKALRQADQVLAQGLALVMFPEGMRSRSRQLRTAFFGSALIASRSNVPILPVGICGTERIKGVGWLVRRPQITVSIGYPFYLPSANGRLSKAELAELTDLIMEHVAELLPVGYRGSYAGELDDVKS